MEEILKIKNMVCIGCENTITNTLKSLDGILEVEASYKKATVTITYDDAVISKEHIIASIERLDYQVIKDKKTTLDSKVLSEANEESKKDSYIRLAYILIIIVGIYTIGKQLGLSEVFQYVPIVEDSMGYGMLFVIGLLTSLHCVAMCGGINITQTVKLSNSSCKDSYNIKGNLLYNLGRVSSYTIIGAIVGGIGSVLTINGPMKGMVALVAGVFMVIMGINMLGICPWLKRFNIYMPKAFARIIWSAKVKASKHKEKNLEQIGYKKYSYINSYYVGLLNGLMPCGPLQSMQLFALSTSSVIAGASSMFFFSLGTVPLMFIFGSIITKLNKTFTTYMVTVSSILVIVLGSSMFSNGLALSGVVIPSFESDSKHTVISTLDGEVQVVTMDLDYGSYPLIEVKKDIPVVWRIHASKDNINGCNNEIILNSFGITMKLHEGINEIIFTPTTLGEFGYSCWMGMIRSSIRVVS